MRLWKKLSLLNAAALALVLAACLFALLRMQEETLRRADEESAAQALALSCSNVVSASETAAPGVRDATLRSVVQYYFSSYAGLTQSPARAYSLAWDGQYLYHRAAADPAAAFAGEALPAPEGAPAPVLRRSGNLLLAACPFSVYGEDFVAYLTTDVSATQARLSALRGLCLGLLAAACALAGLSSALLSRRVLRPVALLTETAPAIAAGNLRLRTGSRDKDEVGALSRAFDKMADSLEAQIAWRDEELQKRQFLLGALSHEMKTPMTAILGYADTLLRMPLREDQRRACCEGIYRAGQQAGRLAGSMTELAGLSSGGVEREPVDLAALEQELRERYPAVRFSFFLPALRADKALLASLLCNLIENALRASAGDPQVEARAEADGEFAVFTVSDRGCGIPAEHLPRLTEPFYRVDPARSRKAGGAGLGLAICKRICELHGGSLSIRSAPGQGTTVTARIFTN